MKLSSIGERRSKNKQRLKIIICVFFTFIIILNFLYVNNSSYNIKNSEEIFSRNDAINDLQVASAISMLQNPFTKNFDHMRNFFEKNYQSSLDFDISLYYRIGDNVGNIIDDTIFSEDNLLYYNSLMKMELNEFETFDTYLDLKESILWYEGNLNEYKYGFVKSIDNSTEEIKNKNRHLIDNLLPIFLLIENIGTEINTLSITGIKPKDSIDEMFYLINSSEFWDDRFTYNGFYHYNSSNSKYSESNFYGILANLLIHRTYRTLGLSSMIRDRAYELANLTIVEMVDKGYMWDSTDKAFYHDADRNWNTGGPGQNYYHLSPNALGIITLLEFWVESGMKSDSIYLKRAIQLYNSLSNNLWDSSNKLYKNIAQPNWNPFDNSLNLKSNALMMSACIKLFEVTGNITYYKRAIKIFNSIETNLYDTIGVDVAYDYSLTNTTKSFHSNLKLSEAYLDAFGVYNSTQLDSVYNVSGKVPEFTFNQDTMNLTSTYSFKKDGQYFDPETNSYESFTVQYDISNASFKFVFKYPNGSFLYQFEDQITEPETSYTLLYDILDTLPIVDGYHIYLWANTSYFKLTDTLKRFDVSSGLINKSIEGLPSILYQGPIVNVSLIINYTRSENLTLTASLEGEDIKYYPSQKLNFTAFQEIRVSFNLTAKFAAPPGTSEIFFKIKMGNVYYLKIKRVIEIGYSFDYSNLIYQNRVVRGDYIFISMNLKNFLPNATQTLNVSFTGVTEKCIEDFITEEFLYEDEIRTVSYNLKTLESIILDEISIEMSILINTTEYYSETFTIEVIPKFELISVSFPNKVPQGSIAYLIIIIQNNQENPEDFSLYINGKNSPTNLPELSSGENRIVVKITPTINPYEFGIKKYKILLKDSQEDEIGRFYFEVRIALSTLNFIIFYLAPIIVPIGIILFFKNKDIKHKKLRR